MMRRLSFICLGLAGTVLVGCGQSHGDLRQWMNNERQNAKPHVTPIDPPKPYVPLNYTRGGMLDPFDDKGLMRAIGAGGSVGDKATIPTEVLFHMERRKEPLEAYPLDVMKMVGVLDRKGEQVALVTVDKLLYQIRLGAYLGQNFGKVTRITEDSVVLQEWATDATGEWIERESTLELQEKQ